MKLVAVEPLTNDTHKYKAVFEREDGKQKTTKFGASGYDDYLTSGDIAKRALYRLRHQKDLKTSDPTRAGFLSMFLLWGNSTSLQKNIRDFKAKFDV